MSVLLTPRTLAPWDTPRPGDVFFEEGTSWAARLTRWGTKSKLSHVGIIAKDWGGMWTAIETRGKVVAEMPVTEMRGYVIRLTDDEELTAAFLREAYRMIGTRYDWAAIGRFAVKALRSRWWTRPLAPVVDWFVPDRDDPLAVICSDHVAKAIQAVWGKSQVAVDPTAVAPDDLFRALVGYQTWLPEPSNR